MEFLDRLPGEVNALAAHSPSQTMNLAHNPQYIGHVALRCR
jgi:hypothetical protein